MGNTQMGVRHLAIQFDKPLLIFLIIPFFKPGCLDNIAPVVSTAFDFWLLVAAGIIGVVYLLHGKMSKLMLTIILFELSFMFSTFINQGAIWECIKICAKQVAWCMFIELCISKCTKKLIDSLVYVLGIECIIDGIPPLGELVPGFSKCTYFAHTSTFMRILDVCDLQELTSVCQAVWNHFVFTAHLFVLVCYICCGCDSIFGPVSVF